MEFLKKKINDLLTKKKFINHNKKVFEKISQNSSSNGKILVEFNNFISNHIGFSYLANELQKKYKSKIVGYVGNTLLVNPLNINLITKIKFLIGRWIGINFFSVYKSFGAKEFFYPELDTSLNTKKIKIYKKFLNEVIDLYKLENFKINNVLVGDLLYDTYLKNLAQINKSLEPTIILDSKDFLDFVDKFISLFLVWEDYFKRNKVKAVIGTHYCYTLAIPLRLANKHKAEAHVCGPYALTKYKKNFFYQNNETLFLKKIFKKMNNTNKKMIIKTAESRMNSRKKGKYSTDFAYVTKSPFGSVKKKKYLNNNKKLKVVIATHAFGDAPHAMGKHIFTDHYQWLKFLTEISKKTDYEWYVKTHPNFGSLWTPFTKHERDVSRHIIKKSKNMFLLPSDVTHNQLVKEGISAVFTVTGTVGLDYAMLNTPVINASLYNPQINYDFNLHPKNKKELINIIMNLKKIIKKFKINKNEIYECYGVKNVFFSKNWLFQNFDKTVKDIGSYHNLWNVNFYSYWINNWTVKLDKKIRKDIKDYISSNNYYLLNNNNMGKF
tara:strand:- start:133 stop:1785 length:1653 start_codon:yes stop_codon:yes gene_type:complete